MTAPNQALDTVSVLCCGPGRFAGKTWQRGEGGELTETKHSAGRYFTCDQAPVSNIDELAVVLHYLESRPDAFVIRGKPIDQATGQVIEGSIAVPRGRWKKRQATGEGATYREQARHWVMFDVDGVHDVDPAQHPLDQVRQTVQRLPSYFHEAAVYYQFSSGTGFKKGVRLHLWYWLARAQGENDLKAWAKAEAPWLDRSVFQTVQPLYTARPRLVGLSDPLLRRSGLIRW